MSKLILTVKKGVHRGCNIVALRSFVKSTATAATGVEISDERKKKLLASFGISAHKSTGKPMGKPIQTLPQDSVEKEDIVAVADTIEKNRKKIEENETTAAEQAWLDSGYIEYMDNQRDKGWKT